MFEERDPEKQQAMMTKFMADTMIPHLKVIEAQLEKNGGFLVGNDVRDYNVNKLDELTNTASIS